MILGSKFSSSVPAIGMKEKIYIENAVFEMLFRLAWAIRITCIYGIYKREFLMFFVDVNGSQIQYRKLAEPENNFGFIMTHPIELCHSDNPIHIIDYRNDKIHGRYLLYGHVCRANNGEMIKVRESEHLQNMYQIIDMKDNIVCNQGHRYLLSHKKFSRVQEYCGHVNGCVIKCVNEINGVTSYDSYNYVPHTTDNRKIRNVTYHCGEEQINRVYSFLERVLDPLLNSKASRLAQRNVFGNPVFSITMLAAWCIGGRTGK